MIPSYWHGISWSVIAVVQHSKVGLSVRLEIRTFQEPVNHGPNVFNSMYVSTWDIPKDRKKSTWQRAFLLNVLAKLPLCAIVGNKVPGTSRQLPFDM